MLGDILIEFTDAIAQGVASVRPYTNRLFFLLLALDFVLLGYKIAVGQSGYNDAGVLAWKLLVIGLLYYLITNFDYLAWLFQRSVLSISSQIGGRATSEFFLDPDKVIEIVSRDLLEPMNQLLRGLGRFKMSNMGLYISYGLAWLFAMICFALIAVQFVLAIIEFHLLVLFSLILVPFLIFEPTKFIGTKPFGAVVGGAVKIGMLAVVAGIVINIFRGVMYFPSGADSVSLMWVFEIIVLSLISAYVIVQIPGLVASLLSGVPSLSAGGAFQNLAALGAGVATVVRRSRAVAGAPKAIAGAILGSSADGAIGGAGGGARAGSAAKMFRQAYQSGVSPGASGAGSKTATPSSSGSSSGAAKSFRVKT